MSGSQLQIEAFIHPLKPAGEGGQEAQNHKNFAASATEGLQEI